MNAIVHGSLVTARVSGQFVWRANLWHRLHRVGGVLTASGNY